MQSTDALFIHLKRLDNLNDDPSCSSNERLELPKFYDLHSRRENEYGLFVISDADGYEVLHRYIVFNKVSINNKFYKGKDNAEECDLTRQIFNVVYSKNFPASQKKKSVDKRGKKILKVLMASARVIEGITLTNIRHVHIDEPYWMPAHLTRSLVVRCGSAFMRLCLWRSHSQV